MKKKLLFFCLVLVACMFVFSGALASQTVKLDKTASVKLADSLVFNQTKNNFTYYKDETNGVTLGYRVADGQVALKDVKATLKKSGYTGLKTTAVNGVDICYGSKKSGGMTTRVVYFNTKGSHFVMLAFTYNASKSKAVKIVNNVVNSIKVKEPAPDPEAPAFSWKARKGGAVSSAEYGGRDLILIYMSYSSQGSEANEYIGYYLDTFKSSMSKLAKKDVQVLVCLINDATDSILKTYAKKYPSMVFGRVEEGKDDDMWTCLERMGYKKETVTYPVVVLRSRNNRLRWYKAGSLTNAETVVKKAIEMADDNVPAIPPDPDEIPVIDEDDDVLIVGYGKYKVENGKAVFLGVTDESITELKLPASIITKEKSYPLAKIAAQACKGLKKLKVLQISSGVTNIGKEAFMDCAKLSDIAILTSGLTQVNIGKNAFAGIAAAPVVKCPSGVIKNYKGWLIEKGVPTDASFQSIRVK